MPSPRTTSDPAIGSVVGGCRIEAAIGRGGMGVVYLAEQIALGRRVALKLLSPALSHDADFRARFQQEARIAASLDHDNVVPIYEAGEADGQLYLVMRHVEGTDLRSLLRREGPLEPGRAARIVAQVASALDAAHANGLVHRDVKPANVLIQAGAEERVYLTDFGLTKLVDATGGLTRTGQWLGTPDYVAPEQIEGRRLDARTDVYALGCVLHEALTGKAPYAGAATVAKLWSHVNAPPPSVSTADRTVPRAFDAVVARALAKDPDDRYASAGGLGRAALAAAERRVVSEEDRSVATGEASPVVLPAPPPPALPDTRVHASAPSEPPAPALAPAPAPARRSASSARSNRLAPSPPSTRVAPAAPSRRKPPAVLAAVAALLLVGGAIGALLLASGPDDPTRPSARTGTQTAPAAGERSRQTRSERDASSTAASAAPAADSPPSSTTSSPSQDDASATGTDAATGAAVAAAPQGFESYLTPTYTLERPSGWAVEQDYVQENDVPRYRSRWSDTTCGCELLVDHLPTYGRSALANAAEVPGGTKEPTTVGAFEDAALRIAQAGALHQATYFIAVDGGNYAMRASAPSAETALALARHVAESLRPGRGG